MKKTKKKLMFIKREGGKNSNLHNYFFFQYVMLLFFSLFDQNIYIYIYIYIMFIKKIKREGGKN
jgi:hypothetical protein